MPVFLAFISDWLSIFFHNFHSLYIYLKMANSLTVIEEVNLNRTGTGVDNKRQLRLFHFFNKISIV
jgi:hypothetical protein